jgi:hypothetical protein
MGESEPRVRTIIWVYRVSGGFFIRSSELSKHIFEMAIGKPTKATKSGKKGQKKKAFAFVFPKLPSSLLFPRLFRSESFFKKEWYNVKAPNCFTTRVVGKTICNRSQGISFSFSFTLSFSSSFCVSCFSPPFAFFYLSPSSSSQSSLKTH